MKFNNPECSRLKIQTVGNKVKEYKMDLEAKFHNHKNIVTHYVYVHEYVRLHRYHRLHNC
jgi:hypothetical protein